MRIVSLFFCLISSSILFGQGRLIEGELVNCAADSSQSNYRPSILIDFTEIGEIKIVSFEWRYIRYGKKIYEPRSNSTYRRGKTKRVKDFNIQAIVLDTNLVVEQVTITEKNIKSEILDIVSFQYTSDTLEFGGRSALCYTPRHAIIFYNKDGSINTLVEVCFGCWNHIVLQQDYRPGGLCQGSMKKLFYFVKKMGIEYGLDTAINID